MASKRAQRRKRCERKAHHETHGNALAAKFKTPNGHELDVYRCPFCGLWVLGHRPGFGSNNSNKRVMRGGM